MSSSRTTTPGPVGALLIAERIQWRAPTASEALWREPISITLARERTGLIGRNGAGKSLLCAMLAGAAQPSEGRVTLCGSLAYVPQTLPATGASLADVAGLGKVLDARLRIESGCARDNDFDAMEQQWDLDQRWQQALDAAHLPDWPLHHSSAELSGGQRQRIALIGALLAQPDVLILDEPSNHLDTTARAWLVDALRNCDGGLLLASHDRELLDAMDRIADLGSTLGIHGGNYTTFRQQRDIDIAALRHAADHARNERVRIREDMQRQHDAQQKRMTRGARSAKEANVPRIGLGMRKNNAQRFDARESQRRDEALRQARELQEAAVSALPVDAPVSLLLPGSTVPEGKRVLEGIDLALAHFPADNGFDLMLVGPRRVTLQGPNGSGKSTLLAAIRSPASLQSGKFVCGVEAAMISQQWSFGSSASSLLDHVLPAIGDSTEGELRSRLALLGLSARHVTQPLCTLSGGEAVKAQLAIALWSARPAALLLLDEPTNHLDLDAIEAFQSAFRQFIGAMIVASHDRHFLSALECDTRWTMDAGRVTAGVF